jgi:predicted secreted Zn-dependent protease
LNTKVLLLGAVVTAFAFTTFATDALLSPRAQGNQTTVASSSVPAPAITVAYVAPSSAQFSPRAQANQIKIVQGVASHPDSPLDCRKNMITSPKAVTECASHVTMPGCMKLAAK